MSQPPSDPPPPAETQARILEHIAAFDFFPSLGISDRDALQAGAAALRRETARFLTVEQAKNALMMEIEPWLGPSAILRCATLVDALIAAVRSSAPALCGCGRVLDQ